jgi:hypothetical protein
MAVTGQVLESPAIHFSNDLMGMLDLIRDGEKQGESTVFHCSMDDFGTCENDGIRGFAGYVATKECWDRFNISWQAALDYLGCESLHTARYLNAFPLFGDQPKSDADDYRILEPFLRVVRGEILERGGFGVIFLTECAGYESLGKEEKIWVRPPARNSFEMFIGAVCKQVSPALGRHNPIAFQIDETDVPENSMELLESYNILKKQNDLYRKSLGALCFADDTMLRPLQAADMLGNLAMKGWRSHKRDKSWPLALVQAIAKDDNATVLARAYDESVLRGLVNFRRMRHQKAMLLTDLDIE